MLRTPVLSLLFTLALSFSTSAQVDQAAATLDQDMDRSIKPGDDFYRYANGGWLKTAVIPAGQTNFDTRAILKDKTSQRVRSLIQEVVAAKPVEGSNDRGSRLLRHLHGRREDRSQRLLRTIWPTKWLDLSIDHGQGVSFRLSRRHFE